MKRIAKIAVAIAASIEAFSTNAITLDNIQFWTGSGTNRAALVVEWSWPEVLNSTTVPVPVADKTLVWGFRFNGSPSGTQMLDAIVAADSRLYAIEKSGVIAGLGYNLNADGILGIRDGAHTYDSSAFSNRRLVDSAANIDAAQAINGNDLYWGGWNGPIWELWHEQGGNGGFSSSPNRGTNQYWTVDDPQNPWSGHHGQWEYSQVGLDDIVLQNGSWVGLSVAAGGLNFTNASDAGTIAYNKHKHAPPSPEGAMAAYVNNTNNFAVQIVSSSGLSTTPYDDPSAILGRPTLKFANTWGDTSPHRTKIVEAAYNKAPDGSKVITKINPGGQITVKMGRKIYDDPNNPYGIDLIVYGNSFCIGLGSISDKTDLESDRFVGPPMGTYGHPTTVSVSPDGTNWYTYGTVKTLFPCNSYRWDRPNHSWTDEQMSPTKPLNPAIYSMDFGGQSVATGLDQFIGSAGGTGFDLKESGFAWIQYVRVEPGANDYTVIDSIAAVNPAVLGDELSITPGNVASGMTNLLFQKPADPSQSLVSFSFAAVGAVAKVSAIELSDLSSYAPVPGKVINAWQIAINPLTGTDVVTFVTDVCLRVGDEYSGTGADLQVLNWNGAGWSPVAFTFNATTRSIVVNQQSQLSAVVISQTPPLTLSIRMTPAGLHVGFTPVKGNRYSLERTTDFAQWTTVATLTAESDAPLVMTDAATPATSSFYRVRAGN